MLLEFLQAYPDCREATSVSIRRIDVGSENGANWALETYILGSAPRAQCDSALKLILPIIQRHFDLAPDA